MLAKIAAIAQSKVALAALGVVLVGGGGGAVAVAATTGHLSTLGVNLNSEKSANASSTETPDSHAHTMGVEGLLVSCSTTTPPATIVVKDSKGAQWTFNVSDTTKFNGDTQTASQSAGAQGGSSATGAGASSAKGDNSAKGGSSSKGDNSASAHAAPTLAQVCALAGSRDVQVQATPNGSAYDAWKVTVQGPGSIKGDSSEGGASTDGSSTKGDSSRGGDSSQGGASTMGGASTKGSDGGSSTGDH